MESVNKGYHVDLYTIAVDITITSTVHQLTMQQVITAVFT